MSSKSSYSISDVRALLSQRVGLDLSPVELAEILWLALQRGVVVPEDLEERRLPTFPIQETEPGSEPLESPEPRPATGSSSPKESIPIVAEPPETRVAETAEDSDLAGGPALPINIPETAALRNRQAIARSLRPLMRKVASKQRRALDEEATVIQIAETQTWSPVVKPEPERWLELAIVIEVTNLLDVWHDTIAEFQKLMERHGAFRNVRTWQLKPNVEGTPQLFLQTSTGLRGSPRSPRELLDASGRRQVLLLSDCTSRAWRTGKIPKLLKLWSQENPVAIVQLLPEHYWDRSALKASYPVALRSRQPGAISRDWLIEGLLPQRLEQLPEGLKLPVMTMQPDAFGQWAKAIAAVGDQQTTGIIFNPQGFQALPATTQATPLTAKQLVQRFRNTASEQAQELADMMAVLPINWSVIRLIQKNLIQEAESPWQQTSALYLAEIFLSGLLRPILQETDQAQRLQKTQQYDFVEGVRDVLLGTIPKSEAMAVGEGVAEAVFKQLPTEVQQRVNADIERRYGETLSYFEAFLIPDLPWGDKVATEVFQFAQVTGQVLRRWGGKYAALAEKLERQDTDKQREKQHQDETAAYNALEHHLDFIQELILDRFAFREHQFDLDFHLLDLAVESVDELKLAEGANLSSTILEQTLSYVLDTHASFELSVRISFSIMLSYFPIIDTEESLDDTEESVRVKIFSNQTVDATAEIRLWLSTGDPEEAEPELTNLSIEEPIRVIEQPSSIPLLQTFEFEVATIALENGLSSSESDELSEAAIAWFTNQRIEVQSHFPSDGSLAGAFDRFALDMGEHYDVLAPLLQEMKYACSRHDHTFHYQMINASETTISGCVGFGHNLHLESLLFQFDYNRATHTITGMLSSQPEVIQFFNGTWFERYVAQKILHLLQEQGVSYNYLLNPAIGLPNGNRLKLDLFFLIEDKPILIECKPGSAIENAINQLSRHGESLGIPPSQRFVIVLEPTSVRVDSVDYRSSPIVADRENFLAYIMEALEIPSLSDELPAILLEAFEFEVGFISITHLETLDFEDALGIVDQAMRAKTGQSLTPLQQAIIEAVWEGQSYAEVSEAEGFSASHVSSVAAKLFRNLSNQLAIPISRKTFRSDLTQFTGSNNEPKITISRRRQQAQQFNEHLDNEYPLQMVQIPKGSFLMGSTEDEEGQESNERQQLVNVLSFFMGKYPITQAQWKAVAVMPQVNRELEPDPSRFKGNDRPVERITWYDAVEFCDRLSQHTGKHYRLPSEAEWEYACRARTTTPFHFGETITSDLANYNGEVTYGNGPKGIYRKETTPVGSFGVANAFGLYDMHGNVWEWCADHWHNSYEGAPTDGSAWVTGSPTNRRLLRGGSWLNYPRNCRSAYRDWYYADYRDDDFGFRVTCSV